MTRPRPASAARRWFERKRARFFRAARAAALVAVSWSATTSAAAGADPKVARLSKGPYLTGLSESGVDVRFELDAPAPASVEVTLDGGPDGGGRRTVDDRATTGMHVVHLTGLSPALGYAYVVRVGGRNVGGGRFTTAPAASSGAALRFIVYGDDRTDTTAHSAVARAIAGATSDFLVNTGDLVEDGGRAEDWRAFFDIESGLLRDRALFVAIGNHELYDDRAGANFARYFGFVDGPTTRLYGTVRLSNARFFFLNAMQEWGGGEERRWLERELARADDEPGLAWRVVVLHHGPWSSGPHGGNADFDAARVPELLVAHKVDIVFSGHDHIYERGEHAGLKYLVSGGGGAPLYRIAQPTRAAHKTESAYHFVEVSTEPRAFSLITRRLDGSILERCGFEKGGGWDCDGPGPESASGLPAKAAAPSRATSPPPPGAGPPGSRSSCASAGSGAAGWR
ncbi:MAG: metallophosphoesterase, partial [Myxococcales bacterium]|nr:metallophosphoesterase [Myxococcales bacterium]